MKSWDDLLSETCHTPCRSTGDGWLEGIGLGEVLRSHSSSGSAFTHYWYVSQLQNRFIKHNIVFHTHNSTQRYICTIHEPLNLVLHT
jgi:hypothetical protein